MCGRIPPTLFVLLLLGGCASTPRLNDETQVEPFAGWLRLRDTVRERPFVEALPNGAGQPPQRLAGTFLEGRGHEQAPVIVLQPGVLGDRGTFRFLAPLLAQTHDVWLVDPPGTGGSSRPDPERFPAPVYTPEWIGGTTLRALARHQHTWLGGREVVLVGHSLGSSAIVRSLTDPATRAACPELLSRVTHVVLIAYPDTAMRTASENLQAIATLDPFVASLGDALGVLDRRVAEGIYNGVVDPERRAMRAEAERLRALLAGRDTLAAAQAMLARFRPMGARGAADWPAVERIVAREASLGVPALVVWGAHDDTLPVSMARTVTARLPNATLRVIPDAKHSVHQERAQHVAELIRTFIAPRAEPAPSVSPLAPAPRDVPATAGALPDPVIRRPAGGR